MKKLVLCLAIAVIGTLSATAQDGERMFKRFKGDVSFGYAAPLNSNENGGILFSMEPKISIIDQLAVGLRIEAAVTAKFSGNDMYGDPQVDDAKGFASYLATADYYFTKNYSFRPFIGGGAGVFGLASDEYDTFNGNNTDIKFGGMFRAGAEIKHFRFGVEFNLIPTTNLVDMNGAVTGTSKNGYIGIKAGFCFGGGPLE